MGYATIVCDGKIGGHGNVIIIKLGWYLHMPHR